ncbi:hypothetical protein HZC53_01540 [Candidatus Uhrbacteria bacterium]|nr:hypothetical protein [Candidatus Uhrbacteria bacterium]
MRKFFLLLVVCGLTFVGCSRKERLVWTVVWTPPENVQTDSVEVQGWYRDQKGVMHPWGTICRMEKVRGLLTSGAYTCEIALQPGTEVIWNVRYASQSATGGFCWVFDQSNDQPCGGHGKDVGLVRDFYNENEVAKVRMPNGFGPLDPPVYFNARSLMVR